MSQEERMYDTARDGGGHWYVSTDTLVRIVTEQGGEGTTPEDAERFINDVGGMDAITTLVWLRIEEYRARMSIVLDNMQLFVADKERNDILAMAAECHTVLQEFVELCEAVGLVETRSLFVVTNEDV